MRRSGPALGSADPSSAAKRRETISVRLLTFIFLMMFRICTFTVLSLMLSACAMILFDLQKSEHRPLSRSELTHYGYYGSCTDRA